MGKAVIGGVIAAAAAMVASVPAQAAPTIYFTNGNYDYPFPTTATVIQEFNNGAAGSQYAPAANETKTANVTLQNGSVPGSTANPYPNPGNQYLSIGGPAPVTNGTYSITLGAPVQFFSFVLGTLDAYNALTLTFADNSTTTYTGAQIIGQATPGNFNSATSGRVTFDLGGQSNGITAASFSSSQAAFEIDSIATAVPEPATWGLMILGVGFAGASLRTRRKERLAAA